MPEADEFFQLLQAIYVFMSCSKAHEVYISMQMELHPDKQVRQMKSFLTPDGHVGMKQLIPLVAHMIPFWHA